MKFLAPLLASAAIVAAEDGITVVCNKDNTIDVGITFDKKAEVLSFEYGTCKKADVNSTQNAKFGWDFNLDVTRCGMDNKLRTLEYNQTASLRVGRNSGGTELTLAHFDIDSYCTYTSTYTVKFNYGELSSESHSFKGDGGLINLTFSIQSYNEHFNKTAKHKTKGGDTIYLGLTVTNKGFNHAAKIGAGDEGKTYAPLSCEVTDTEPTHNHTYTLFESSKGCKNDDVDLVVGFVQATHMWTIQHTLFLLGNYRSSTFELSCEVVVCDEKSPDETPCRKAVTSCKV